MPEPLVTIAIPTMNRANLLQVAIRSALSQAYGNVEVLVSDNASTDDTAAVLAQYRHPRLRAWTQPVNLGMSGNWNFLLSQAKGEYFCVLSDDDTVLPEFASKLVPCLQDHPSTTIAYSTCELEDGISTFPMGGYPLREPGLVLLERILSGSQALYLCSMLMRTGLLREAGGFPTCPYALDFGGWLPLLLQGEVAHCHEILARYNGHSGSETARIAIAEAIGGVQEVVSLCASDSRVPPDLQRRFRSLGNKLLGTMASQMFLQRAALGASKTKLIRALPSIARFMAYNPAVSVPTAIGATLLPASVLRHLKSRFRDRRTAAMMALDRASA